MKHIFFPLITLVMVSCRFDSFERIETPTQKEWVANSTIEELKSYAGDGTINEDLIISGFVISSDSTDNIYKKIYIQNNESSAVVLVGMYDLWVSHPLGSQLNVRVKGAACAMMDSLLHIGFQGELNAVARYTVVESGSVALNSRLIQRGEQIHHEQPRKINIEDITPSLAGQLIELEGEFDEHYDETFAGTQRFVNTAGKSIGVYTSSWALFANTPLPQGHIRLRGILTYHQGRPQLIMRSEDDVILGF